jgi:hypothetical protein
MRNILRSAVAKVKVSWFEFVAWKGFVLIPFNFSVKYKFNPSMFYLS